MASSSTYPYNKKVILIIVEGLSDLVTLERSLKELYKKAFPEKYEICIYHTDGDLMSQEGANTKVVLRQLEGHIKRAFTKFWFIQPENIEIIIQIVDTDGVFIPDSHVKSKKDSKQDLSEYTVFYDDKEEMIFCEDPEEIQVRNKRKSHILRNFIDKEKLFIRQEPEETIDYLGLKKGKRKEKKRMKKRLVPYRVYYFSCNLEHFFHNNANVKTDEENAENAKKENKTKETLSNEFNERTKEQPYLFENRILEHSRKPNMWEYEESWEWLEEGTHSLQRRTNLDILVKPLLNSEET